MFSRFFRSRDVFAPMAEAAVPPGRRVYAVGDIHGRLDLLDALLDRIAADDRARGPAETTIIFLGDLIDRGPDSAGVVSRLIQLTGVAPDCRVLLGNHEETFLLALAGNSEALRFFTRVGGRETALSYGISPTVYEAATFEELFALLTEHVPDAHVDFLRAAEDLIVIGDYAFAHAGVRPGTALDQQKASDLRWIRREFLEHRSTLDKVVVHGHTVAPEVEMLPHRIGVDTGAYRSGRLTALGLEARTRWVLQAEGDPIG